jgi:hypothetical protein
LLQLVRRRIDDVEQNSSNRPNPAETTGHFPKGFLLHLVSEIPSQLSGFGK